MEEPNGRGATTASGETEILHGEDTYELLDLRELKELHVARLRRRQERRAARRVDLFFDYVWVGLVMVTALAAACELLAH